MSSFIYPGKDRAAPRLRRFAAGILLVASLVAAILAVRPFLDPKTFDALLSMTPLSKEKLESILTVFIGPLILIPLSWLMSKWVFVEVLEFHLFPWFDDETLRPVTEKTGLLRWIDFEDSPAHDANLRLRAWLSEGVHDGSWPIGWAVRGCPALKESAFSYALLLGPNGVGKSQLVREAARERLGTGSRARTAASRRGGLARIRHALVRWFRRVLPRFARLPDDPWHAGVIVPHNDWSERLMRWRPSAPTVLILDDAKDAMAREAIDILDKNSGQFWYSVKLIIVDQFTPSKLVLTPFGRSLRDHKQRDITILSVPDLRWSGEQARRALSGGVWIGDAATGEIRFDSAHDNPEFWQTAKLERLSRALDGNPLMLAEAAVWLSARNARGRPYRTIDALLNLPDPDTFEQDIFDDRTSIDYRSSNDYRSAMAHCILKERVDDVVNSHKAWAKEALLDEFAVFEALCCASLTGGVPMSAFAVFGKQGGAELDNWVVRDGGNSRLLPPVGSWLISEAFIERALRDYESLKFEALVRLALAVNPVGLARQLTRRGRLARRLFEEVTRLQEQEAGATSALALNLFEVAATRAIWADRQAVPQALAALERLPASDLAQAQAELEAIGTCTGPVPDVLVAALLLTVLGSRRFAEAADWDWRAWDIFHPLWARWRSRYGNNLDYVPPTLREPMIVAGVKMYEAFFSATGKLNDPGRVFDILADALQFAPDRTLLEAIPVQDEVLVRSWPAVFRQLFVLRGMSWNDAAIASDGEGAKRRLEAMAAAARSRLPADADPQQRARVEAFILALQVRVETEAGGAFQTLERITAKIDALVREFSNNVYLGKSQLFATVMLAQILLEKKGDQDLAWALGEKSELMCGPFLFDEICVGSLIWCWAYVLGRAKLESNEVFGTVMARLRSYADNFPSSHLIMAALVKVLSVRFEALVAAGERETTEAHVLALASQMETVARQAPEFADVQWLRASTARTLAEQWHTDDKKGLRIGAIARNMDAYVQPFPDHLGLHENRLGVWGCLAHYESCHGASPDAAEQIARRMTWAAAHFGGVECVSISVASAWAAAVSGWHRDPRAWSSCERALRRLEVWLAENPSGSEGAVVHLSAWGSLLVVHRKRQDAKAFERLESEALNRAEAACAKYSNDQAIAETAGFIFTEAALARREFNAGRAAIEDMAMRMQALARQFPRSKNIRENADLTNGLLHGPAEKTPLASRALPASAPFGAPVVGQLGPSHSPQNP